MDEKERKSGEKEWERKRDFFFKLTENSCIFIGCDDAHLPLLQGVKICQVGNRTLLNKTDSPDIYGHDEQLSN